MNTEIRLNEVAAPSRAPVYEIGEKLGLCSGLLPEWSERQFRCAQCNQMQQRCSWMVWVPDSVRMGDPAWSVEEAARQNALNGRHSGWCLSCAPKATKSSGLPWYRSALMWLTRKP